MRPQGRGGTAVTNEDKKKSCQGCNKLAEIDGRLVCLDHRSLKHCETIIWPGAGRIWKYIEKENA